TQNAGIVHQRGYRAQLARRGFKQTGDIGLARDVGFNGNRFPAGVVDLRYSLLGGISGTLIVHRYAIAHVRGFQRRGAANAAACSGDDEDSCGHVLENLCMVRITREMAPLCRLECSIIGRMPSSKRKVILACGISLDGYIARPDGSLDFLDIGMQPEDFEQAAADFYKGIDTVVMGSGTLAALEK